MLFVENVIDIDVDLEDLECIVCGDIALGHNCKSVQKGIKSRKIRLESKRAFRKSR